MLGLYVLFILLRHTLQTETQQGGIGYILTIMVCLTDWNSTRGYMFYLYLHSPTQKRADVQYTSTHIENLNRYRP